MHNIIVIGASAGGVEALQTLVRGLPSRLPAAVFIVIHVPPNAPSILPDILNRSGVLTASTAQDGERIEPERIYVAPPDLHLLVEPGITRVYHGPRENRHRPAIDPLFRSAAQSYGRRVAGVILTGNLDDGAQGLRMVKALGGVAIVQDPRDAANPGMPENAIRAASPDHIVPLDQIPALLTRLVGNKKQTELRIPSAI